MTIKGFVWRTVSVATLAAAVTTTPASLHLGLGDGFGVAPDFAYAKDGRDDDSGGRDDNSGRGSGGGRSDRNDDDSGGSRSDRNDDDSSGRGSGGDRSDRNDDDSGGRDDSSGRGRGGDDGDDDDDGGRGRGRGGDDDDDGSGRGRGRGGDDAAAAPSGSAGAVATRGTSGGGNALRVTKVEEGAAGIEVTYSNGVREEIENGRYERKDASGRTLVQRRATPGDFERIRSNMRNSGLKKRLQMPVSGEVRSVEVSGDAVEVRYTTGWKEELEGGRYELKDPNNNTVVERRATQADRDRIRMITGG